ncbi:hypothetical protein AL035_17865 [Salipiger aestuarii]|uniref:Uncharacterized protein n=1 Tax=Salipiger aestuarii TaxID=568098 RepID=A0A327YSL8_9RHOB|nr:hypothetical protein [Salipiger aestuarii]KAB2539674.1 hypothetical protein AL035_17865 [Salipiger aestuarii]RAK24088.1 hypothetical protein ATI53_1001195 [Salipiger aestuarii]
MSDHLKLVVSNPCSEPDSAAGLASRSNDLSKGLAKELDRYRMQVIASEIWSDWLRLEFPRPEDVAVFFGVRSSSAWNWWNASTRPTADKVMIAVLERPGFLKHLAAAVAVDQRRAA